MRILYKIITLLNAIIPKNPKQIYFFSTCIYKDNVTAVLDEFLKHNISKHFRIIVDGIVFEQYKGTNIEHVKHKTLKSLWRFWRSKYVIYDNGIYGSKKVNGQITVNTWHGIGLKKIGYYTTLDKKQTHIQTATYVIAYSNYFINTMSYAFGIPKENVLVTGEPRNDYFFIDNGECMKKIGINKNHYKKVIIWMPTYRTSKIAVSRDDGKKYDYGIPLINSNNISVLNNYLIELNILLIIKYHSLQDITLPKEVKLSNIRVLTSEDLMKSKIALNSLISECDALITDYSSVYFNYLLLNRPICFAYDDFEIYASKRGFMFENVEPMMPGYKANNFEELTDFIKQCAFGIDPYVQKRVEANRIFNAYNDNKNSYRLLQAIGILNER